MSSPFSLSTSSSKGLESNTDQKPSFMPVSNLFNAPSTSSPLAAAPPRTAAPAVPPGQEKATAANMQIVQAIQECCRNIAKKLEEAAERIRSHDQGVKSDANNIEKLEKEMMELSRKHDHLSTLVEQLEYDHSNAVTRIQCLLQNAQERAEASHPLQLHERVKV